MTENSSENNNGVSPNVASFSPVILAKSPAAVTSQKNLTGLPRVARDIAADVYNNIQKWNDCHIMGANVVKEIAGMVASKPGNLSAELEKLADELYSIVQNLKIYANALQFLATQMSAVVKLRKDNIPVFISLSAEQLRDIVQEIAEAYKEEFKRKQYVLENICFSKSEHEVMFHASCWTYQEYILKSSVNLKLETLLIETGHRKIS